MSEKAPQSQTVEDIDQTKDVDYAAPYDFTPEEETAVLRKIDRVILPVMAVVYFFQCQSHRKHTSPGLPQG